MRVYLDNNATTMTAPEVLEAMAPFWSDFYGNPSSIHSFGGQVKRHIDRAREQTAALIGASPADLVFTGGGTEGDNMAILGVVEALEGQKRHIVTSRVEHPAVLSPIKRLENQGYHVTELRVDSDGALDMATLKEAITPQTALVSIMWANNETGVIFPIEEIAQICQERAVVFHTDAVQVVGKIPVDVSKVPVDLLSLSGHKLHGPKGVGAIYIRKKTKVLSLLLGGHQERNRRAGTENVTGIVGLGKAAELALNGMDEEVPRITRLRDRLEKGILERCKGARLNGTNRLPNTLNVSFEYIEGESILMMLDDFDIQASSGSACASGSLEPSHVLRAMGVPFTCAHGSIRFSLSRYNTEAEIDQVVDVLPGIVDRLRELSPFAQNNGKGWA